MGGSANTDFGASSQQAVYSSLLQSHVRGHEVRRLTIALQLAPYCAVHTCKRLFIEPCRPLLSALSHAGLQSISHKWDKTGHFAGNFHQGAPARSFPQGGIAGDHLASPAPAAAAAEEKLL